MILALVALLAALQQPCVMSSSTWLRTPIAPQTGAFTLAYDATPAALPIDANLALGARAATSWTGYSVLVRFAPSGRIDVRNGGAYSASTVVPYTAGVRYHVRVRVDVPTHRYSVWVTPAGGSEVLLANAFRFRLEQDTVTALAYWTLRSEPGSGASTVCNVTLTTEGPAPPLPPPPDTTPAPPLDTVRPPGAVVLIAVYPPTATTFVGDSVYFDAIPVLTTGHPGAPNCLTWSIEDPPIARVGTRIGQRIWIRGVGAGTTTVRATCAEVSAEARVTFYAIQPPPPPVTMSRATLASWGVMQLPLGTLTLQVQDSTGRILVRQRVRIVP